jgi:signal transduction histidine kinase
MISRYMAGESKTRAEPSVHDLRQPLTAILSAATALQADPTLDDEARGALLSIVVDNAERLRRMLQEIDPEAVADRR